MCKKKDQCDGCIRQQRDFWDEPFCVYHDRFPEKCKYRKLKDDVQH